MTSLMRPRTRLFCLHLQVTQLQTAADELYSAVDLLSNVSATCMHLQELATDLPWIKALQDQALAPSEGGFC